MAEPVAVWMACRCWPLAFAASSRIWLSCCSHLLTNWAKSIAELVGVPRHPVRAARLDLLVHAVQGGLQFALERAAELLDQMLQLGQIGALDSSGHVTSPPCCADALLGPRGRFPVPASGEKATVSEVSNIYGCEK